MRSCLNSLSSVSKDLYDCIQHLCPNFKDLLNSDGPAVKVLTRFFYLASLAHSSVKDSYGIYVFPLRLSVCFCLSVSLFACLLLLTKCNMLLL